MLEILVVISIIGISLGFITLAINPTDQRRSLQKEAINFENLLKLVVDEAIFTQKEIGLKIKDNTVSFLVFDSRMNIWKTIESDSLYKDYHFPGNIEVTLQMEDAEIFLNPKDEFERKLAAINPLKNFRQFEDEEEIVVPDIYIFSSGELTAFELIFRISGNDEFEYQILANDFGKIELKALHES